MTAQSEALRTGDPAAAFEEMRGEVALLRRAVERLAAERAEAPDYSETLGQIARNATDTQKTLKAISDRPAFTPEVMAAQIHAAADKVRQAERTALAEAREGLEHSAGTLRETAGTVRTVRDQRRRVAFVGLGGALAGLVVWAVLPGAVARLAPESWRWPEALAARTIGMSRWDAGVRLVETAHPGRWREVVLAACPQTGRRAEKEKR